ncbi:MAG TPA: hypothetical protein VLX31_05845 [Streptosporangiaceae bacterium]|nr:hypothetical protein [Streptosporangiaceae bacterium]
MLAATGALLCVAVLDGVVPADVPELVLELPHPATIIAALASPASASHLFLIALSDPRVWVASPYYEGPSQKVQSAAG